MAIGIGSRFDVLWDRKEVGLDQMSGMDVYNFLHMVSSAGGTNSNTFWKKPSYLARSLDEFYF